LTAKLTKKVTEDHLYKRTTKRVGLFDSGVGGLSVLRHLVSVTQGEGLEFVYLGDAARCPYGNRAKGEIATFVDEIVSWLTSFQLDSIVMACNTSAAVAKDVAVQAASRQPGLKVYDLIEPTAEWLVANPPKAIGVMSTINTANSKAFSKALVGRGYEGSVQELGCPKLVPLIESGRLGEADCEAALTLALTEYLQVLAGVDALVLGCTHYPFASEILQALCGPNVTMVETGAPVARRTRQVLEALPRLETRPVVAPGVTLLSTGDPEPLARAARRWLGLNVAGQHLAC